MLYTGKGDDGTTTTFGCNQRMSKSSAIAEALGALDETNSVLGLCKVEAAERKFVLPDGKPVEKTLHAVQQQLFIIQAELAGAQMTTAAEKVRDAEAMIEQAAKELPPIRTFFISGGTKLAALCDTCRTVARRAERRVVQVAEEDERSSSFQEEEAEGRRSSDGRVCVGPHTLAYLNRLSSLLYALSRLANHQAGIVEEAPDYK